MDMKQYKILNCPDTALYIPDFITQMEESNILNYVSNAPKPKWTQLSQRRLLNYGGIPHKNGMIAEQIPSWLQSYISKINNLGVFEDKTANHVLVNEYDPGVGIMPHLDGPLFYPTITTISCGSHTILELFSSDVENQEAFERKPLFKLLLEPRSLLVLKDDMYKIYLHGIRDVSEDVISNEISNLLACSVKTGDTLHREKRVSLTIRHVPKTSSLKIKI